jgi:hypothetical protein
MEIRPKLPEGEPTTPEEMEEVMNERLKQSPRSDPPDEPEYDTL